MTFKQTRCVVVALTIEEVDPAVGGVFEGSVNGLHVLGQVVPEVVDDGGLTGENSLWVRASPKILK